MSLSRIDPFVKWSLRALGSLAGLLVSLILLFLLRDAWPAVRSLGSRLAMDASWHPTASFSQGSFGLPPMLWASLSVAAGAVLLATPLALGSAIFRRFYAPGSIATAYLRLLELLAGIPSVVYGFWGLVVLTPWIAQLQPPGPSLLAGILVLGLMILPTIALLADSALGAVPADLIQGAAALGMGRWSIVSRIALPASRQGIAAGVVLGGARAIGETMAVLMVCGNIVRTPDSLFAPVRTLTANIALEMGYALEAHRSALFACGLVLLLLVFVFIGATETFIAGRRRRKSL